MARIGIDHDAIARFLARFRASHPLRLAILFGSRARGEELRDSDLDLLVVSETFDRMPPWERITLCLDFWDGQEPLEVVALTPAEFDRRKDDLTIVGEAVRTGREVTVLGAVTGEGDDLPPKRTESARSAASPGCPTLDPSA